MSSKSIKELRNLTVDELSTKLRTIEAELFQTKMKKVTGQLADTSSVWRTRKLIARIKTLQSAATAGAGSK